MRKENFNDAWGFRQNELNAVANGGEQSGPANWTDIWEELVDRAPRLLMQLAMDTFDTNYRGDEAMIVMDPPDMTRITDPMLQKTSADVRFGVKESDATLRRYHIAALDKIGPNMTTYMMAYNYCDAMDFAEEVNGRLVFQWPRSLVLCFQGGDSAPYELLMDVGQGALGLDLEIPPVPIVNASAGTIEELIEHNLLILFPFFIERYRQDMDDLNSNEDWLDEVVDLYKLMAAAFQESILEHRISLSDGAALADAIASGLELTTAGFDEVEKRIGSVVQKEILDVLPKEV